MGADDNIERFDPDTQLQVEFRLQRYFDSHQIIEFVGHVCVADYEDGGEEDLVEIGRLRGVFIPEVWSPAELLYLADSVREDVYQLANIEWRDDDAGDGLRIPPITDSHASSWVGVESLVLDPKWRGQQLGYHVLRELTRWCASHPHTLLVARPHPLVDEASPAPSEASIGRLRRYWSAFGLRPIGDGGVFGYGFELKWPEGSWMRESGE